MTPEPAAVPDATAENHPLSQRRRPWVTRVRWFGDTTRGGSLALIDQGIASATRFLTTVIIGRACGPEELGIYSLAFIGLLFSIMVQEALVTTPYTIYANRVEAERGNSYAGSALVYQIGFTGIAMIFLGLVGAVVHAAGMAGLAPVMWVIAGFLPFTLLREFGRRFAFAHLRVATALALDGSVAVLQVGGLLWLHAVDALSALTAFLVIGVSCALASSVWLFNARRSFGPRLTRAMADWRRNWNFGKWVFAGHVVSVMHGYLIYWLLAIMLGTVATGVLAATESLVLLANPVVLGISNYVEPRNAKAFGVGGYDALLRVVRVTLFVFGGVTAALCLTLFLLGDLAMSLLYGDAFGGQQYVLLVLALDVSGWALCTALGSGLRAIERPDVNFKLRGIGLVVTAVAAPLLIVPWGLLGATCGLLAGTVCELTVKWVVFTRLVGNPLTARRQDAAPLPLTGAAVHGTGLSGS